MPRANSYVLGGVEATPTPKRTPTNPGEENNCTPLGIALRAMDGSGTAVVFQNTVSPLQIALPLPQQRGTEVQIRRPGPGTKNGPARHGPVQKLCSHPTYKRNTIFNENLVAVHRKKYITLDTPIINGMLIL